MSEEAKTLWENVCELVRKWKEDRRFPRKLRILCNGLLILLLLLMAYGLLGCPTLSIEARYRRVERANMVGPARILGVEKGDYREYDRLLVARDGEGVILYTYDSQVWGGWDRFIYREKKDSIMVLTGPCRVLYTGISGFSMPVVIFDEHPKAQQALAKISIPGIKSPYEVMCVRRAEGYLFGELRVKGVENGQGDGAREEGQLVQQFAELSDSGSKTDSTAVINVTVDFFDVNHEWLCQETTQLRSVLLEAHLDREGGE